MTYSVYAKLYKNCFVFGFTDPFSKSSEPPVVRVADFENSSGSQPRRRGTQGGREEVQGVPPNIGFSHCLQVFLMKFINNSLQGCLKVVA